MSEYRPTRSAVIEMKDERRAMREGYVFLDEKCLLLAGEILRQLHTHARLQREFAAQHDTALAALQAAVARHGLQELDIYPPLQWPLRAPTVGSRALMGVRLQQARWSAEGRHRAPPLMPSPEAEACSLAFAALLAAAAPLAAVQGNLERLSLEYRRSVRRARALQDVMLPELDRTIDDIEARLEELEQEDAIAMRQGSSR
jgi:V/A-type H+-transporting ATPase subunit D